MMSVHCTSTYSSLIYVNVYINLSNCWQPITRFVNLALINVKIIAFVCVSVTIFLEKKNSIIKFAKRKINQLNRDCNDNKCYTHCYIMYIFICDEIEIVNFILFVFVHILPCNRFLYVCKFSLMCVPVCV